MRRGMTLIELLVVLMVIGILAAIFTIRLHDATRTARLATVRSDLRAFVTAEYVFYVTNQRYATDGELPELEQSPGVELTIAWANHEGFAATARHVSMDPICGVFTGPAPPGSAGPAVEDGVVTCE